MPQPKRKTRKEHRPRVDAIVRHIKAGSYDNEIGTIRGAIEDRLRSKQEAVLGLVKEAFGDDFVVTPSRPGGQPWQSGGVVQRGAHESQEEWEAAAARAEAQEASLRDQLGEDDLPESDPDYESRSPIIGSIDSTEMAPPDPDEPELEIDESAPGPEAEENNQKKNPFEGIPKK